VKRTATILLCLLGCQCQVDDLPRVARLRAMLVQPDAPTADTDVTLQDRTENLQAILNDTEGTEDATESEYHVGDYVLYDYFRSSPPCAPCIRWTANEKASVTCRVKQWDTSERPVGFVDSVPTFRLFWCNTETKQWDTVKLWVGFTTAANINRQIQEHQDKQTKTQSVVCAESAE